MYKRPRKQYFCLQIVLNGCRQFLNLNILFLIFFSWHFYLNANVYLVSSTALSGMKCEVKKIFIYILTHNTVYNKVLIVFVFSISINRVLFSTIPPNFQHQNEKRVAANQSSFSIDCHCKTAPCCLIKVFHGNEDLEEQLKRYPLCASHCYLSDQRVYPDQR